MTSTLTRIYSKTRNEALLTAAVAKGWITEEGKQEIITSVDTK